ncbi:MAG: hypothetical protein K9K37_03475 [Desulfocapsa sp.]|nr:hypothetical protein [Desulfocapsa sp.]
MKQNRIILALTISLVFSLAVYAFAEEKYNNRRALNNVSTAKTYFDVNVGTAKKLVVRLKLIDTTYEQLVAAGVRPEFVVGFRGKASNFVTKGNDYVFKEDLAAKKEVHDWVRRLQKRGIPMEQCLIALGFHYVAPEDILPEIEVVQNGYVSMIAYQAKGFSQVPMD